MKYTPDVVQDLTARYQAGETPAGIAQHLGVPTRSVIAKLSSLGVYHRKQYLNKRGELPVKKEQLITEIASLLDANLELLESLEKVNKRVLQMICNALGSKQPQQLEKSA